mmetsp:Transcript_97042/g.257838  ORF Transcript_97042/g.257838 Transcript_97042/m.257838 type:complete len:241 (+) Transcript_97042:909-1631(+)
MRGNSSHGNLDPLANLEPQMRQFPKPQHWGQSPGRREVNATQAEVDAAVEVRHLHAFLTRSIEDSCQLIGISDVWTMHSQRLRDLGVVVGMHQGSVCCFEPCGVPGESLVGEEFGQNSSLCQLAEIVEHALPLCNGIKVLGEVRSIPHQRMVRPRRARVIIPDSDAEGYQRNKHAIRRPAYFCRQDHKVDATPPPCRAPPRPSQLPYALHSRQWLLDLTERQLLEVVVGLEKNLPSTRAG